MTIFALGSGLFAPYPGFCQAADRPVTDLVPVDNLIVYMAKPYGQAAEVGPTESDEKKPGPAASIATILTILNAYGLIPDEGQVFADIVTALPLLGRYEHAMILLDASSRIVRRPDDDSLDPVRISLRLKHLQTAIVFRTNGNHTPIVEQLNRIVGRYTNREVAQLTPEKVVGYEFQRLADDRLPGWAVWEWGRLDDFFVVSFGAGAFEKIAKTCAKQTASLSSDTWFQTATTKTKGRKALARWFISLERLEKRLGEAAQGRHKRVIAAMDADKMTHDLWSVGLEGRALSWYRCYRRDGKDQVHRYSDPANYPAHHRMIVPDQARRYAIINAPTRWLVDNLPRAWVASQSQPNVEKWTRIWRSLEHKIGIDLSGNLINHLGNNIVIFDYPPHPLEIPFALTVAIEINDKKAVKMATDALLTTWGQYLDERAERKGTTLVRVKVKKSEDDIWYLQAGILGPALKVTDRYVVISWSPQALREALKSIEEVPPGKPDAGQGPKKAITAGSPQQRASDPP